jgi:FtsP/CotA-like multicopper oxidase with cupredoxin domain
MGLDPIDRRSFLGMGGMAFLCTLAGQQVATDQGQIDVSELARGVKVPPRVEAADGNGGQAVTSDLAALVSAGPTREYWISAEERPWNIVPTHRDQMMAEPVKQGKTTFNAYGYRPYSADFGHPIAPATVPGPLIEAEVGDTVIVHFRNKLKAPVTMHPHGIFYANEMDGTYKGKWTDPGGFVQSGRTFTYVWECKEGTEGTWLYHDHGPMDPLPVFKGLHGPLVIRKPSSSSPSTPGIPRSPASKATTTASTARPTPAIRQTSKRRSASGSPSTSTASTTSSTPSTSTATAGPKPTARSSTTKPSGRPTPSGSNSPRTTQAAGSTTATSSSTCTRE